MAALPRSREFTLPDEGEHILKLVGQEITRVNSAYPDGKQDDGKADVLILTFASNLKDQDGNRQELRLLLPPTISPANKTGRLARLMVPGLDPAADDFDPEELLNHMWTAYIVHEETKSGKQVAWPVKMKPYVAKNGAAAPKPEPKPAPKTEDDPEFDPFADE